MKKLTLAYFGTPYFSALFLEKLLTDITIPIEVKFVVTQPDKPVGRKRILTPSPVKVTAKKYGIKVIEKINEVQNIDIAFLFAYGNILPRQILDVPKFGFWNTHPSLLPLYRGASPVAYPLILGDKKTGVTLIKLDEKIDHGPIIAREEIKIDPKDKRSDLEIKLTELAFKLFRSVILNSFQDLQIPKQVRDDILQTKKQDETHVTFTRLLTKDDGFIPLVTLKKALSDEPIFYKELPAIVREYFEKYPHLDLQRKVKSPLESSHLFFDLFRGLYPWPGIWTKVRINGAEKRLKITDVDLINNRFILKKVQLEGKKEVDFSTFKRAYSFS